MNRISTSKSLCLAILAAVMILSVLWCGDIMHESDQASLIDGAWRLARGEAPLAHPGFYRYDKYFLSYWILAGVFKILPTCDPILTANSTSVAGFWLGLILAVAALRSCSLLRLTLLLGAICAPACLVHLPYLAPSFFSAGLLFAGLGLFRIGRTGPLLAALCWAAAVGCRADALLLTPLLAWLAARQPGISGVLVARRSRLIVIAMLATHLAGQLLTRNPAGIGYSPFFVPRVYLAYLIFGMGSGLVVLLSLLYMLIRQGTRGDHHDHRVYWWCGALATLLPFLFYSAFMFSPRHWMVVLSGIALLVLSPQWEPLAAALPARQSRRLVALILLTMLPLFVGIRLPFVKRPRPTLSHPTLFPTADGRAPMGALLSFMFSPRRLDHNQQTWLAARAIPRWEEVDGCVPVLNNPLQSIMSLAIRLCAQTPCIIPPSESAPLMYVAGRPLVKHQNSLAQSGLDAIAFETSTPIADLVSGHFPLGIVRLSPTPRDARSAGADITAWALVGRQLFGGNEFDWHGEVAAGPLEMPALQQGHSMVFVADHPFTISHDQEETRAARMALNPDRILYAVQMVAAPSHGPHFELSAPAYVATSTYPDYMRIQHLK